MVNHQGITTHKPWLHYRKLAIVFFFLFLFLAGTLSAEASGQNIHEYSGEASVVNIQLLWKKINLVEVGPLPESGGALERTLLEKSLLGTLNARVLHATTIGLGDNARSEASVADVGVTVSGVSISASVLMAEAGASCVDGETLLFGRSHLANLVVNGHAIEVSGEPNQAIDLPGVRVVINEQSASSNSISVTALHVSAPGLADVALSSAEAGIDCYQEPPPGQEGDDFVTGGGFISGTPSGETANFGVGGGIKNGDYWGHLTYIDQAANLKVHATAITGYEIINETTRKISGTARINNRSGYTFEVTVSDNGEPGVDDTFYIDLSNGYAAGGAVEGGNIQLHIR
jgi:hypothetical protein